MTAAPFQALPASEKTPRRKRVGEWLWLGNELDEARSVASLAVGAVGSELLRKARAAAELADRTLDPIEPLRAGSGTGLALSLYREAAYFALSCLAPRAESSLANAFRNASPELLRRAAGTDERLGRVHDALVGRSFIETAELPDTVALADAREARAFVHGLLELARAPEERVKQVIVRRWLRVASLTLLVITLALVLAKVVNAAMRPPDLARGKPWRVSSKVAECEPQNMRCLGTRTAILFHTSEEVDPWFEVDLGGPQTIGAVEIDNRSDCCPDRAIPLVIEASDDRKQWRRLASHDQPFSTLTKRFAKTEARYLRVRVTRRSLLHLNRVSVYAR